MISAEALRYLGAGKHPPDDLRRQVAMMAAELESKIRPRYIYQIFSLRRIAGGFQLYGANGAEMILQGRSAEIMLDQCGGAVLLLCTLGAGYGESRDFGRLRKRSGGIRLRRGGTGIIKKFPGLLFHGSI